MFPHGVLKIGTRLFDGLFSRGNGLCNLRLLLLEHVPGDDAVGSQQGLRADKTGDGSRHGKDAHQKTKFSMADFTNHKSPDSHTLSRFNSRAA